MPKKIIYTAGIIAIVYSLMKIGYEWSNEMWTRQVLKYANDHLNETFGEFLKKEEI